jgi:hypothetical protein
MKVSLGMSATELTGNLHDGLCLRQEFTAVTPKLISVDIYFATYKRKNPGTVVVEVRDYRQELLAHTKLDATKLEDNSMREFGLGADLQIGQKYELRVFTQQCRSGFAPTACYGNKTASGSLFIGARLIRSKELKCVFNYEGEKTSDLRKPVVGRRSPLLEDTIEGLVSVVVPHYNCQDYLPKCLASLAKQTYSCLEVIVVDDGSKQKAQTKKIIDSFKPMIPALRFIQLKKNGGAPVARNAGASMAVGEYIYFCDSDIELYAESLEVLVRTLLNNQGASFAYGGFKWGASLIPPKEFDADQLRARNYVTTNSLVRRSDCPEWDERLQRHQDWDLWLTVIGNGGIGVCCGKYLFETPIREDGISNDSNIGMMDSMAIVRKKHFEKDSKK